MVSSEMNGVTPHTSRLTPYSKETKEQVDDSR